MILVGDYIMICNDSNDLYQIGERKTTEEFNEFELPV